MAAQRDELLAARFPRRAHSRDRRPARGGVWGNVGKLFHLFDALIAASLFWQPRVVRLVGMRSLQVGMVSGGLVRIGQSPWNGSKIL